MNNNRRKQLWGLVIAALITSYLSLFTSSCTVDSYDKGEGSYSLLCAELVEAHANSDKQLDWCLTDESEQLTFTEPVKASGIQTADSMYRALLYYNKVEGAVEVVSIGLVNTIFPHHIKEMKTDPVRFESMWMSTSRRYLNLGLYLKTGNATKKDQHHTIGLNIDTLILNGDGTRTAHLAFYHDQGGLPEYYSQRSYISIPTDSIDADSIYLRVHTYQGITEKRFKK